MYKKSEIAFDQIPQLSQRDKDYQHSAAALRPFYRYDVNVDSFAEVIAARKQFATDRKVLVDTLAQQYSPLSNTEKALANVNRLADEDTYTIITAHQPSLLTGPLYYIYKICSTIKLTQQLKAHYPAYEFVPVFIIGGEDHDFEEIASLNFFNKTYTWATEQVGATGRMTLDGLSEVLSEVKDTFGTMPYAEQLTEIIDQAYEGSKTYGDFALRLTHSLFGQYGLVTANMDKKSYKELLLPHILRDIEEGISKESVELDQAKLTASGYKAQAHARQVNIFYHHGDRHRVIDQPDGTYQINEKTLTKTELTQILTDHPENISPNVVLRPVFQELIFPNLAYIGGGGELAYWMERTTLFDRLGLPFPMLIRRDSLLLVDKRSHQTLEDANISIQQAFGREEQIINQYAQQLSSADIDLTEAKSILQKAYDSIIAISDQIDPHQSKSILADHARVAKGFDNIENKLLKAEKRKNETAINKVTRIKQKLFPGNDSLQERKDNFIPYYLKHGPEWIDAIIDQVAPLDLGFKVLVEE